MASAEDIRRIDAYVEVLQHLQTLELGLGRIDVDASPRRDELLEAVEGPAAGEDDALVVEGDLGGYVVVVGVAQDADVDAAETQLATEALQHRVANHAKRFRSDDRERFVQVQRGAAWRRGEVGDQ